MIRPLRFIKASIEDPASRLTRLMDRLEPRLRRRFLEIIDQIRRRLDLDTLETLLRRHRFEEASRVIDRAGELFAAETAQAMILSATSTAEFLRQNADLMLAFDQTNTVARQIIERSRLRFIREFTRDQRLAVRMALADGIRRGVNPRESARLFRNAIGLTSRQQGAVNNFRRLLQENTGEALTRKLRDRRFDGAIRRAARDKVPLSGDQIERMVGRYQERYLSYRAEVIARTESLRVVHQGNEAMYEQAYETGELDRENVEREWHVRADGRQRDWHDAMRGQTRASDEPFISGNGNALMHPGDPNAPPEETVQCRCAVTTRITGLPDASGASIEIDEG